jgi:hypothetical protein
MKVAIGIILLLVALWSLYGTIRMWPPGRDRPGMLWPSTRADIVRGVFLVIAACGTGVALIRGASWWWLLVAGIAVVVWVMAEHRLRRGWLEETIFSRTSEVQEDSVEHDEERQEILVFLASVKPLNMLQQEIAGNIAKGRERLPRDEHKRRQIVSERLETLTNSELDLLNRLNDLSPPNSCIGAVDKWIEASQLRLRCYPLMQQSLTADDKEIAEQLLGYTTEVDELHRAAEKELSQLCADYNIQMTILKR